MAEQTPLLKEQAVPPSAPPPVGGAPPTYQSSAPPPGYSAPQQPPPVTQVVVQPQQVVMMSFSDVPVNMRCPNCNNDVMSRLDYVAGSLTWIIIFVLIVLGFWLGCCLIPLCIDGLKDVHHTCPVCSYHLGTYKRL